MKGPNPRPAIDRFNEQYEVSETLSWDGVPCWIWTRSLNGSGYARIYVNRRLVRAHRFAYEYHIKNIPEGLDLDHLCRNRACVNPNHLEPVTRKVNLNRGSQVKGNPNAAKTHCKNGHPLSGDNLYLVPGNTKSGVFRRCRACERVRQHAKYIKRRDRQAGAGTGLLLREIGASSGGASEEVPSIASSNL